MFERWHRAVEESQELDLLPVMNLFMVLIPFLLMGAAFFHIGVIPTSLPTHTPSESDVPKTPTTVSVNLSITADGFSMSASSTSLSEEDLAALSRNWAKREGAYDLKGLVAHLKDIKQRYPKSNTLIVLPHPELKYDELVEVLDATRECASGETTKDGKPAMTDLFPVVVFSQLIAATDEASDGADETGAAAEPSEQEDEAQEP